MKHVSTRQVAKRLGLSHVALARYIAEGKIPAPETIEIGGLRVHTWTEGEIEHVRQILPKIANGRKTRYKKNQTAPTARRGRLSSQQSAKTKAQPPSAVPRKKRASKKSKPASG